MASGLTGRVNLLSGYEDHQVLANVRLSVAAEEAADEGQVTEYGHLVLHLLHVVLNHTTDGDGVTIIDAGVGVDVTTAEDGHVDTVLREGDVLNRVLVGDTGGAAPFLSLQVLFRTEDL